MTLALKSRGSLWLLSDDGPRTMYNCVQSIQWQKKGGFGEQEYFITKFDKSSNSFKALEPSKLEFRPERAIYTKKHWGEVCERIGYRPLEGVEHDTST